MVSEKESRVKKLLKSPLRFMVKARDFYVNGMTQFSDQLARYDTVSTVPMSFAFSRGNASSSDYRELVLAQDLLQKKKMVKSRRVGGLGRIEEDKPCDYFGGDDSVSEFGINGGGFRRRRRFAGFAGRTPAAGKKRKAAAAAGVC